MDLVRWDPFAQAMNLRQAVDRLFDDSFMRPSRLMSTRLTDGTAVLPLDVYHTKDEVVVKAPVPGLRPDDLDINLTGETLTIRGEIAAEELKDAEYFLQERLTGSFSRSITLPVPLDSKRADATFENGVVTIRIPKAEEARTKAIKVKVQKAVEGR